MSEKTRSENHDFSKINQNSYKLLTCKQGKISFYVKVDAGKLATTREYCKIVPGDDIGRMIFSLHLYKFLQYYISYWNYQTAKALIF